jgi:ribonuclease P protein component
MSETFGKEYKLCRQKIIDQVFKEGSTVKKYPIRVQYILLDETMDVPFQITVSAPKRIFRKAHDRNYIKRLMREAIRKNKLILETYLQQTGKRLALFMIYSSKELFHHDELVQKTNLIFDQIIKQLEQDEKNSIQ